LTDRAMQKVAPACTAWGALATVNWAISTGEGRALSAMARLAAWSRGREWGCVAMRVCVCVCVFACVCAQHEG
jgi:hypothetical protein